MQTDFDKLSEIIKKRRTLKVRSTNPVESTDMTNAEIHQLFELAAMAPFHLPANAAFREESLESIVPWRYFTLKQSDCIKFAQYLNQIRAGLKSVDAICEMLNSCYFMALPVWLPFDLKNYGLFDGSAQKGMPTLNNLECIAAASASVQNLLLGATAMGKESYWYTGGIIRTDKDVWNYLGIPVDQKLLLGAVFVFPSDHLGEGVVTKTGTHRNNRGQVNDWMQWINIDE